MDSAHGSPRVDALIVSFNTMEATLACLRSLRDSVGARVRAIVVDNGSTDGSAEAIAFGHPEAELIRAGENLGFGRACNLAYARSTAPYVLLLNSDCLVNPGTVAACLAFLNGLPGSTAVAPQLRHPGGSIQRTCRRFPGPRGELMRAILPYQLLSRMPLLGSYYYGEWDHADTRTVDQPAGAFLLMRSRAWGIGPPFDERFFMFYEDVDLCRRLWDQGPIWFLATASAVHIGEHSTGQARISMAVELTRSRFMYFEKWHGVRTARLVSLLGSVASAWRAAAWQLIASVRRDDGAAVRAVAHRAAARAALDVARGVEWSRRGR